MVIVMVIVELQNPTGPIFARLTSMLAIKSSEGIKPNAIQHITIFGFISFMYTAIFESSALHTMQNQKSQKTDDKFDFFFFC